MPDLKLFFFRTLFDWLSAFPNQSFTSFLDLLDLLTPVHFLCPRCAFFDINKSYNL